jgi:hypothetical protein
VIVRAVPNPNGATGRKAIVVVVPNPSGATGHKAIVRAVPNPSGATGRKVKAGSPKLEERRHRPASAADVTGVPAASIATRAIASRCRAT